MADITPVEVIDFWFGAPDSAERSRFRAEWFKVDASFDDDIRRRFLPLWHTLHDGGLEHWRDTPEHTLAYVIVADQFPRNCFRGTATAFATDAAALLAATTLVDAGDDTRLTPLQRCFAYLPFEHAESLAMQDRAVALYTALTAAHPDV